MPTCLTSDEEGTIPLDSASGPPSSISNASIAAAVESHFEALFARALFLSRSEADAWDLVQSTLELALRARARNVPPENMKRWLTVIMQNHFVDGLRRFDRRSIVPLTDDYANRVPSPEPQPEEPWKAIDPSLIQGFVSTLPEIMKIAFRLKSEGATYREIAEILHIPLATVGSRLHRARLRLRKMVLSTSCGRGFDQAPANNAAREYSHVIDHQRIERTTRVPARRTSSIPKIQHRSDSTEIGDLYESLTQATFVQEQTSLPR
jgi:RNA polymerase sigma-70 factor (ECF subfamily)